MSLPKRHNNPRTRNSSRRLFFEQFEQRALLNATSMFGKIAASDTEPNDSVGQWIPAKSTDFNRIGAAPIQTIAGSVGAGDQDVFRFYSEKGADEIFVRTHSLPCEIIEGGAMGCYGKPFEVKVTGPEQGPGFYSLTVSSKKDSALYRIDLGSGAIVPTITSQWDDIRDKQDFTLGPFLYNVPLENKFTIKFPASLPGDLRAEYRIGGGQWKQPAREGSDWTFTLQVAQLPAGDTRIHVRVLDAGNQEIYNTLPLVPYYHIRVADHLGFNLRFKEPSGAEYENENVRFLDNVPVGEWQAHAVGIYLPVAQAYAGHNFGLDFTSRSSGSRFTIPLSSFGYKEEGKAGKFEGVGRVLPGSNFDDVVQGESGFDYDVRIVARRENFGPYSKPFTTPEQVFVTRLPEWMGNGATVEYKSTDVFGASQQAYVINIQSLMLEKELPTTAGTPFKLFDGLETDLHAGMQLRAYVRPTVDAPAPILKAEDWIVDVKFLNQQLISQSLSFFPNSGIKVEGRIKPRMLELDGAGITVQAGPKPLASGLTLAHKDFTGFDLKVPLVGAVFAGLNASLKLNGSLDVKATEVSLEGQLKLLIDQSGHLTLQKANSFLRLNLNGKADLVVNGEAGLELSLTFSPPANLTPNQKKALQDELTNFQLFRLKVQGTATANLQGAVQANFAGWPPGLAATYDQSQVVLNGKLALKYDYCFFSDGLRELLKMKPCGDPESLQSLYDAPFGPVVVFGKPLAKPDVNDSSSYNKNGNGLSAGNGSSGEGEISPPIANSFLPARGAIHFDYPLNDRLGQLEYSIRVDSNRAAPTPGKHFLDAVLVGGETEIVLQRTDLASLNYQPQSGTSGFVSTPMPIQLSISPGTLRRDAMYFLEFRLHRDASASSETVDVTLEDLQYEETSPELVLRTETGSVDDGIVQFGADSAGGRLARVLVENTGDTALQINSVEVIGSGFELVNPPPGEVALFTGTPLEYQVKLLDAENQADAILRIVSNDPDRRTIDLVLKYDGTTPLDPLPPRDSSGGPIIQAVGDREVNEGTALIVPMTAIDPDPADGLVFRLTDGPAHATIDPVTGEIRWTAPEEFLGGSYTFTVAVTEVGSPEITDSETFEVRLSKSNRSPELDGIADRTILQGESIEFFATASDEDFPAQRLTYQLEPGAPAGVSLDAATGRVFWTTSRHQLPGDYEIGVRVTDDGNSSKSDVKTFHVIVHDVNERPVLVSPGNQTIDEGESLDLTFTANDADGDSVHFRLISELPAGATFDPQSGALHWTPSESQGPGNFPLIVEVIDDRTPELVDQALIVVTVNELNQAPTVSIPEAIEVPVNQLVQFVIQAVDPDDPPGFLSFESDETLPAGAQLHPLTGEFTWTPNQSGVFPVTFQVKDWREPVILVTKTVTITVGPDDQAPELIVTALPVVQQPLVVGQVTDETELASFEVRFLSPATAPVDIFGQVLEGGDFFLDQLVLEEIFGGPFVNGNYVLEFVATDSSANIATTEVSFLVDLAPPDSVIMDLVAGSDTLPLGDRQTQSTIVDLEGETEANAFVEVLLGEDVLGSAISDASGRFTISQVPLEVGRNVFPVSVTDQAGNVLSADAVFTRSTVDGRLGPDGFGYQAQSVEAVFEDIRATGNLLLAGELGDTAFLGIEELNGFQFDLYGTTYDSFLVNSHGTITFGDSWNIPPPFGGFAFAWPDLPTIAPLWSPLFFSSEEGSGVLWELQGDPGSQRLVVQWNEMIVTASADEIDQSDPITFQVILDSGDGSIEFNYLDLDAGEFPSVGPLAAAGIKHSGQQPSGRALLELSRGTAPNEFVATGRSTQITLLADEVPPILEAQFTGELNEGFARDPSVAGFVLDASGIATFEAGFDAATLEQYADIRSLVQPDGTWMLDASQLQQIFGGPLADGLRKLHLRAVDPAGLVATTEIDFRYDVTPPSLIRFDLGSESDSPPLADQSTDRQQVRFIGHTEPNAFVSIVGSNTNDSVIADETGRFEFVFVDLDLGDNEFEVILADLAGNEHSVPYTVTRTAGNSVGPDACGYFARSVAHEFLDISSSGNEILVGEDDASVRLAAAELNGFRFRFYGANYDELYVNSNGVITFDSAEVEPPLDVWNWPEQATIFVLGEDLVTSSSPTSAVFWEVRDLPAGKQLIVQWNEVVFADDPAESITFQVVLNAWDQTLQFNYLDLQTGGSFDEGEFTVAGVKGPGDQYIEGCALELPTFLPNAFVSTGMSTLITSELIIVGPPKFVAHKPAGVTTSALSEIMIHFDRAMDQSSFALADDLKALTGPTGDLRSQVTGFTWQDSRTLSIEIAPQSVEGSYTLSLGPNIHSLPNGLSLDQDGDGIPGEVADDSVSLTIVVDQCLPANAAGYVACSEPFQIDLLDPDGPGVFKIVDDLDDGVGLVDLGTNTFRLYETTITGNAKLFVGTNGLISLTSASYAWDNSDLSSNPTQSVIAPLWDDWITDEDEDDVVLGKFESVATDGRAQRLVVQWTKLEHHAGGSIDRRATFQAVLELNTPNRPGDILFIYDGLQLGLPGIDGGDGATVGIKNASEDAADPLLISYPLGLTPWVADHQAIRIRSTFPTAAFVEISPDPRATPVETIAVSFSQPVVGVDLADFLLTRNGVAVPWNGTTIAGNGAHYTLHLSGEASAPGQYSIAFAAGTSGIADAEGRPLSGDIQEQWAIDVANSNSPPSDIQLSNANVDEELAGIAIGELTVTDPDLAQTHTFAVSDSRFEVVAGNLKLVANASLDFEAASTVTLQITATDSSSPAESFTKSFTIHVRDANDSPSDIEISHSTVKENVCGMTIGSLSTLDQDANQTHAYAVSDSRFQVVGSELKLANDTCLEFVADNAVEIDVTTTDSGTPPRSFTQTLIIQVTENPFPWRYETRPADTNADGQLVPLDALRVINQLNNPTILESGGRLPRSRAVSSTLPFYDVNGDGFCTPNDVLRIVNVLNASSGEGESSVENRFADLDRFMFSPAQPKLDAVLRSTRRPLIRDEMWTRQVPLYSAPITSRTITDDGGEPIAENIPEASKALRELESALEEIAADVLKGWLAD